MSLKSFSADLNDLLESTNGCEYTDIEDAVINKLVVNKELKINVLHLNVRSLLKNVDNLTMLLKELEEKGIVIHIVALCETYLNNLNQMLANIENYKPVHSVRDNRMGGGTSIYVHDSIRLTKIHRTPFISAFESTMIEAKFKGKSFAVAEIYRPPGTDDTEFTESLQTVLDLCSHQEYTFICSDFNYDLLKSHLHKPTENVANLFLANKLLPMILKPTRITHSTSTLIDNIYVRSKKIMPNESYVITDCMSNHYPCVLSYSILTKKSKSVPLVVEKRKISDDALFKIQHRLLHSDWSVLDSSDISVHDAYKFLSEKVQCALDEYAPMKRVKISPDQRFHEPWLTVGIKKCNQKSRRLCKKAKNSTLVTDHKKYVNYRNVLNRIKNQEKRSYYCELFKKIGKNSKLLWEVVNNLVRKTNSKQSIVEILKDGHSITNQCQIANAFNDHFVTAGRKVYESVEPVNSSVTCTDFVNRCSK